MRGIKSFLFCKVVDVSSRHVSFLRFVSVVDVCFEVLWNILVFQFSGGTARRLSRPFC